MGQKWGKNNAHTGIFEQTGKIPLGLKLLKYQCLSRREQALQKEAHYCVDVLSHVALSLLLRMFMMSRAVMGHESRIIT